MNVPEKREKLNPDADATGNIDISLNDFISSIFSDVPKGEQVLLAKQTRLDGAFINAGVAAAERWLNNGKGAAVYFNISTVRRPDKGEKLRRRKRDCRAAYCFVADDIGTKVKQVMVDPSWILESSEGSFQYGYILAPEEELGRYEAFVTEMGKRGYTDAGAGGCNRLMRVPKSINLKEGRNRWASRITRWKPKLFWSLDGLAKAFGINLDDLPVKPANKLTTSTAGITALEGIDPLHDWLGTAGYIVSDDGGDFVTIKCPWADEHTSGSDTAGYSPLGRGTEEWAQTRGFQCFHEHCKGRGFIAFMKAMSERGAPKVSDLDPLPWLQDQYTYIGMGSQIADLHQRAIGGHLWLWDLEDWSKMHKGRVLVPGRDTPVELKTAFLEHKKTRKAVSTKYWPVRADEDVAIIVEDGQELVNTYVPPNHPHTSTDPDIFLDHIDFLLADDKERDLFLNWLAFKIQNPNKRSYAVVMIAEDGYGVGRSWLRAMLEKVLQGNVNTATLPQLIGKGTAAENNYNDWAAGCQFLIIEEARDNISKEDFYNGYETFKQRVDTRVSPVRVNPKYDRTRDDFMFFNALIFSNHSDALAIPSNDRRICVLSNPSKMADAAYYDRLEGSLTEEEARKIYWHLMERDISNYDHVYPMDTEGKRRMIDQNIMPSEAIRDHILEKCAGDIFTKKMLRSRVISAADALDYEGISHDSGGVVRTIWGKMGPLRDEKNGARYLIGGDSVEIRAMRNKEKWEKTDAKRSKDVFEAELLKNDKTAAGWVNTG